MSTKNSHTSNDLEPAALTITRSSASDKIATQIEKGKQLCGIKFATESQLDLAWDEYKKWNSYNAELLKRIFSNSSITDEYTYVGAAWSQGNPSFQDRVESYIRAIESKIVRLESLLGRLDLIPEVSSETKKIDPSEKNKLEINKLTFPQLFHILSIPQILSLVGGLIFLVTTAFTIGNRVHQWNLEEEKHFLTMEKNQLIQEKQVLIAERDSLIKQLNIRLASSTK